MKAKEKIWYVICQDDGKFCQNISQKISVGYTTLDIWEETSE
jgi:hypothetical protein